MNEIKVLRKKLERRFYTHFTNGERLLAVGLNYITHIIYYDYGRNTPLQAERASDFLHAIEKNKTFTERAKKVLKDIPHCPYKAKGIEIIYRTLEQR